ncbi:MAG: trypsin-like peptidase domain-containing protein [Anaerolineae bacterium]|nr:trypsin-like peptidase domain-containing protein [Anaerolineae bacterium]
MSDTTSAQAVLDSYSQAIQAVIEAARPAVVRVQAGRSGRRPGHRHGGWKPGRARSDHGSGFIIDAQAGTVITNFHVVRSSERALVHLHNGTATRGTVIGADADNDLAVVQIEPDNLTALNWGSSDDLRVGSIVLALGNPDGDSPVATSGIVSALDRRLRGPSGRLMEGLIQTDTIFNPGMSGGPLVNSTGEVVGINTASLVEAQGVNLAISSARARTLINDLIQHGQIQRPILGIAGERQRLYGGLVRHHGLQQTHGVFIHEAKVGYPAAAAGIQPGDILVSMDGAAVEGLDDLHRVLGSKQMGEELRVKLLRDLDLVEVSVLLSAMNDNNS